VLVSPKLSHHGAEGRLQTLALAILVFTTVVVFPSKTQAQQQRSLSCIAQHVLTSPTWTEYFDITDTARYLRILEGDKYGVKQIHEPSSTSGRTLNFSDMRGTIDVTTCSPTLVQSG
jgi:hypothetical protein